MIKNIVFDFGGVLVQYDFLTFFAKILGSKEDATCFMQKVLSEKVNNEMDLELHEFSYYIEQQKRQLIFLTNIILMFLLVKQMVSEI